MAYEPPVVEEVGSVRELTLAHGGQGSADQILWFTWGNDRPPGGGLS
ncbi:lasso RiPP family leader peptide-containing protein [Jiangella asiatica]|nr:lasso RiPP family leader peptide-containing protein [Jiangella asiatica]